MLLYFRSRVFIAFLLAFTLSFNTVISENLAKDDVKLALIYTVTTPELKADVVREIKQQIGDDVKLMVYEAPEVFNAIKNEGYVSRILFYV